MWSALGFGTQARPQPPPRPFFEDSFGADISQSFGVHPSPRFEPQRPPTPLKPAEAILKWFIPLIQKKTACAITGTAVVSSVLNLFVLLLLQTSIFAPFATFSAWTSSLTSLQTWSTMTVGFFVSALIFYALFVNICNVEAGRLVTGSDPSVTTSRVTTASLAALDTFVVASVLMLVHTSFFTPLFGFPILFLTVASVFGHVSEMFAEIDSLITPPSGVSQLSTLHAFFSLFRLSSTSPLPASAAPSLRVYKRTLLLSIPLGIILFGFKPTFGWLFSPSLHLTTVLVIFRIVLTHRVFVRLVKIFVLKPITFPFPPLHVVPVPSIEDSKNLVTAIESSHVLLKLLAFYDLRRVAWTDHARRTHIFQLSQPGGHPRNWMAVHGACQFVFNAFRGMLETERAKLVETAVTQLRASAPTTTSNSCVVAEVDRDSLLVPRKFRDLMNENQPRPVKLNSTSRPRDPRIELLQRPIAAPSAGGKKTAAMTKRVPLQERLLAFFAPTRHFCQRYDADLVILAIESQYMLVIDSYTEDKYGVVQRDLRAIFSNFVALARAVVDYNKVKQQTRTPESAESEASLAAVDHAVHTAIFRLHNKFGEHLRSLGLSEEDFAFLQTIA